MFLVAGVAWVIRPAVYGRAGSWMRDQARRLTGPLAARAAHWGEER